MDRSVKREREKRIEYLELPSAVGSGLMMAQSLISTEFKFI